MTNAKSTKRALLASVMALLLCFSMLLGTTFAWFTDTVTSGSNVIQSGTLDIDLVDADGNSMAGEIIEFVAKDGRAQDEILWEPGCTYETEPVYVVNNGTLALKYQIIINGIEGDAKLLEAIEWTVTVGDTDTATALADLNGTLLPNVKSEAIVLSGHMKETAGNEYMGLKAEGISISVIATQYTYEEDSFNDQYDNIALVSTADQLKAAVEAGGNVMLANDIAVTDLMMNVGKNVTTNLYLNGKTIASTSTTANRDGKEAVNSADNYILFNVAANGSLNIVGDGKIIVNHTGDNMEWNAMTTAVHAYGDVTVSDGAEIINYGGTDMAFGLNAFIGGNITVKDSTIASAYRAIRVMNGTTSPSVSTVDVSNSSLISYTHNAAFWHHAGSATSGPVNMIGFATEADAIAAGNTIYGKVVDDTQDPETLWIGGEDGKYALVDNADELTDALANGGEVVLTTDIVYNNTDPDKQMLLMTDKAINFDGNGKTITTEGADPSVGNHGYVAFIPTGDDKSATVSNLTVTGTGFVELGDYNVQGGNYVANNLVIKNLVSTLRNGNGSDFVGCAFMQYGTGVLNNCVMTGTTALIAGTKAYDAGFGNSTTTTINGGKYGVIRVWEQAHVTIKGAEIDTIDSRAITYKNLGMLTIGAGTHVGTINLIPGNYTPALTIEEGATVDAIVYNGVTYTQAEWLAYVASLNA